MWDWWCFSFNSGINNKKSHPFSLPFLNHHQNQNLLPVQVEEQNEEADGILSQPLSALTMLFIAWLRSSTSRYLILALCSPLLLPLFCATFPFLCALEVFFRLCRRRRRRRRRRKAMEGCDEDWMHQSEADRNGERLLQRYLEDQLILVAGSVYECGYDEDDEGDAVDLEYYDNRSPALQ